MCLASILLSCRCSTLYYSRMVDEDFSSAYLTETQTYHILQISQVTSQFLRVEVVCRWQSITATAVIIKKNQFNPFLCCERLSSQSQVDSFASVEEGRLTYIAEHQDDFRCEHFQGVADAVGQGHLDGSSIGKKELSLRPSRVEIAMGNKISKMVLQYAVFLVHLIYLSPSRVTQSGLRSKMPLYLSLDKKAQIVLILWFESSSSRWSSS